LLTDVFGFIDVLFTFGSQKAKGQVYTRQWPRKPCKCNILVTIGAKFTKMRSRVRDGPGDILIRFTGQPVKGQGHRMRRHNRRRQPVEFHLHVVNDCNLFKCKCNALSAKDSVFCVYIIKYNSITIISQFTLKLWFWGHSKTAKTQKIHLQMQLKAPPRIPLGSLQLSQYPKWKASAYVKRHCTPASCTC